MTAVVERILRTRSRLLLHLLAVLLSSCAPLVTSTTPRDVDTIVVLPVDNRTGNPLYADAAPLLGMLRDAPAAHRATASGILTDELRAELSRRGFRVLQPEPTSGGMAEPVRSAEEAARWAAAAGLDAPVLYVSLSRWDATAMSHVLYVDVALDATLVHPEGRILWTSRLPARPIDGGGASSVALAYPAVARRVVTLVLADLRAADGASRDRAPAGERKAKSS